MKYLPLILIFAVSCATSHHTVTGDGDATLWIELSSVMQQVEVYINGERLYSVNRSDRIRMEGIHEGQKEVRIVGTDSNRRSGIDHTQQINFQPEQTETIWLDVPGYSDIYYLTQAGLILGGTALTLILMN